MSSYINFDDVTLRFQRMTNMNHSLKENFIKFLLNVGQSSYVTSHFNVLSNLSFTLNAGDKMAIIGKNGAGKTTLLRLLCGIYQPQSGHIKVAGRISSLIALGIGLNYELTGRENIFLTGLIAGFSYEEIKEKERQIIEFADIGDAIDIQTKYYSTGMNMRLNFSVATQIEPDILVIDELFAGGDADFINKSTKRLDDLILKQANIFICAPHNMDYVRRYCNKLLYLSSGKAEYFGDDIEYGINHYLTSTI